MIEPTEIGPDASIVAENTTGEDSYRGKIPAINKKTWWPNALVVNRQLERAAECTEMDFSDIRAIIAQTWALPIYMPLHVINFAKDVMNARPDRTSIHCLLLLSND